MREMSLYSIHVYLIIIDAQKYYIKCLSKKSNERNGGSNFQLFHLRHNIDYVRVVKQMRENTLLTTYMYVVIIETL